MRHCVIHLMGPYAERVAAGEDWDFLFLHDLLDDQFVEEGDTPFVESDFDIGKCMASVGLIAPRQQQRFLKYVWQCTEEFGSHPAVKAAIERLADRLIKVDFLDGEIACGLIREGLGDSILHYSCLGPKWRRRAGEPMRAFRKMAKQAG